MEDAEDAEDPGQKLLVKDVGGGTLTGGTDTQLLRAVSPRHRSSNLFEQVSTLKVETSTTTPTAQGSYTD